MISLYGLRWVVALPAEAAPIIQRYELKLVRDHPFKVYADESCSHGLVVSGVGRTAAAAATIFLAECMPSKGPLTFLNVGIAGGRDRVLGSVWRVHKVTCRSTGKVWYPGTLTPGSTNSASLVTVDQPEFDYPDTNLFDMEAAGFFEMATRLTSLELIQSVKLISDHSKEHIKGITRESVAAWMSDGAEEIESIAVKLSRLCSEENKASPVDGWEEKVSQVCHFSVTQRHQLRRLLQRYWALRDADDPIEACLADVTSGAQYLKRLSTCVEALPVMWGER